MAKKPTALKIVENNPGKRPLNDQEPEPPVGIPFQPETLSDGARKAWERLAPLINDMGVLTKVDGAALERMCETYAEIVQYQREIAENGATYMTITEGGQLNIKPNPAVAMLATADRRFKTYLSEFGLTPASRTKIKTGNTKPKDPMGGYFD